MARLHLSLAALLAPLACGTASPAAQAPAAAPPPPVQEAREEAPPAPRPVLDADGPVAHGELPWWSAVKDGIYRLDGQAAVLGVGESADHHHIAEGFLRAKVNARLHVRRAAEPIRFKDGIPEPEMIDLFVTRDRRFLSLFLIRVPADAQLPAGLTPLAAPGALKLAGRHRVGRHVFEGDRHLYLECDVEGPIANPDWGRSRASARP